VTIQDFIANIDQRWPKTPEVIIDDITKLIQRLSDPSRAKLWEKFLDTYTQKSGPNRADFKTIIDRERIPMDTKDLGDIYWKCPDCGTRYWGSYACPKCKTVTNPELMTTDKNYTIERVQADCFMCRHYAANKKACPGPVCADYGNPHGGDCQQCICFKCCLEERVYRGDPIEYKRWEQAGKIEDRSIKKAAEIPGWQKRIIAEVTKRIDHQERGVLADILEDIKEQAG